MNFGTIEEEEDYDNDMEAESPSHLVSRKSSSRDSFQPPVHKVLLNQQPKQQQQGQQVTRHLQDNSSADVINSRATSAPPLETISHAPVTAAAGNPVISSDSGDKEDENHVLFSPSSSSSSSLHLINMYQPLLPSPSPSPTTSSSKLMMMMDQNEYNTVTTTARNSLLMNKALNLANKKQKRRESISSGDLSRKRPVSTSVLQPRLTKSTTQQQQYDHKRRNSSISMITQQQQLSGKRNRYYSLQPPPPPLPLPLPLQLSNLRASEVDNTTAGVHWDPHIDAFDILRAKITGITRSMQEFHVNELFFDQEEKRKKKKLTSTTSSPLITTTTTNNRAGIHNRRFSLAAAASSSSSSTSFSYDTTGGHRRIRSSHDAATLLFDKSLGDFHNDYQDDSEEEEENTEPTTSPNLTALFLTTNNLIHSRLDELSETASIKSFLDNEEEVSSRLEWQKKFLNLVTCCIHQSEALESLSTDVLNTEHRVRELLLVNETIHEQFNEREKQYEERIRECQEVAQQQFMMIESLEELTADINMKAESKRREQHRQYALLALVDGNRRAAYAEEEEQEEELDEEEEENRWDFQRSVADLLNMNDKHDLVQKMRWDIGMFVGGGVGTGHIIHTFEDQLNGIDMMIAGTGTTTSSTPIKQHFFDDYCTSEEEEEEDTYNNGSSSRGKRRRRSSHRYSATTESYSAVSPSIGRHIKLYQHHYILHLNKQDRKTKFALLPRHLWIPDDQANCCQFQTCATQFTFFQRKHHCRRCGYIMCARHSANRLPLFGDSLKGGQWSRVCDHCFYDLIMVQK